MIACTVKTARQRITDPAPDLSEALGRRATTNPEHATSLTSAE